jgi:hypothetical protein
MVSVVEVWLFGCWGSLALTPTYVSEVYRIEIPELNFHVPSDVDWFLIRSLPSGPGRGGPLGCHSALRIALAVEIQVERADIGGSDRVSLIPTRDPRTPGMFVEILALHPPPLRRITPSGRSPITTYTLDIMFRAAPRFHTPGC